MASTIVAEGVVNVGEIPLRFRLESFVWTTHPRKGVRYRIVVDDRITVDNADAEFVVGTIASTLVRMLDQIKEANRLNAEEEGS